MPTQGWVTVCPWCHENVNTVPPTARRMTRRAEPLASTSPEPGSVTRTPAERMTSPAPPTRSAVSSIALPWRPTIESPPTTSVREVVAPTAPRPPTTFPSARPNPPTSTDRMPVAPRSRPSGGDGVDGGQETRVLATATYVTGTARLEPGRRYGIAIRRSRFLVVGPVDLDSKRIALDRPVVGIQVSALEGRLVVSEQSRSGVVLAFMSVAGAGVDDLAGAIRSAARDAE